MMTRTPRLDRSARAARRVITASRLRENHLPLQTALREPKRLDPALYETAELFFG
jgi:hypothetical protein